MSQNGISKIEGLEMLAPCLELLDLGHNMLRVIENLEHLSHLKDLWINSNQLSTLEGSKLEKLTSLTTIYLEHNEFLVNYKVRNFWKGGVGVVFFYVFSVKKKKKKETALKLVPTLEQLDADYISK